MKSEFFTRMDQTEEKDQCKLPTQKQQKLPPVTSSLLGLLPLLFSFTVTRHSYVPESAARAALSWYSAVESVVAVELTWISSRTKTNVCVRSSVPLWLTSTWQRKVTGVPVSTVLLGRTWRSTPLMVYPARKYRRGHGRRAPGKGLARPTRAAVNQQRGARGDNVAVKVNYLVHSEGKSLSPGRYSAAARSQNKQEPQD